MSGNDLWLSLIIVAVALIWIIRVGYRIKSKKGATLCNGCTIDSKPKVKEFKN